MTIGLLLWIGVTVFLLWFWGSTNYLLYQQKRGWKTYAAQNKLRYRGNRLLDSPDINGSLEGYQVSIFATDHNPYDARTRRVMTTVEITLKSILPVPIAVASGGMVRLVEDLGLTHEYRPDAPEWDISFVARAYEDEILQTYLTRERIVAFAPLLKRKRSWAILIFSAESGLLRLDTPEALETPAKLKELVNQMLQLAKVLELSQGEDKIIASRRRDAEGGKQKTLRVEDNVLTENHGLTLEE